MDEQPTTAMTEQSLTEDEATARAALVDVERYDIAVDMRGLLEGEVWASTSTIAFGCTQPGAATFLDCVAEVVSATLNGVELDLATISGGRIPLLDLAAENVAVISVTQSNTGSSQGILRTVDPTDELVYVWTSFEADDARRAWACFDQPDLKAPHAFTVTAPDSWTVTSNSAPDPVIAGPVSDSGAGSRVWTFPDTPALSTYVVVVNAGPFVEMRQERGGYSLGLFCRQSLKAYLERDAEELWRVTEQGLAFFGERFAMPFAQQRYDQVFVPNMGGAMENWGCVTWTDNVLYRSDPTPGQRTIVANILLHEMAHMWFGDLVTMQWWDDLWLNEAFASWAATWAQVNATSYTDAGATILANDLPFAYRMDMGPASHPIRGVVPDVAQAMSNFDAITYAKGEAVLGQLVAYVGEDAFVTGLRAYFADHAWGNTRLADLMHAVGAAAGVDLDGWTGDWFDRAGTDTIRLVDGALTISSPDGAQPRPHRLDVGSYARTDSGLRSLGSTEVTTSGTQAVLDLPDGGDLALVNDGGLTFAAVRTDDASLRTLLELAGSLPDPRSRAIAVTTAWDMLVKGELGADDVLTCLLGVLATERSAGIVEPFLRLVQEVSELWTPAADVAAQQARVAGTATTLAEVPELASAALRALSGTATTDDDFARLATAARDNLDLAWRAQARLAVLGRHDPEAVEALLARDPDPDAAVRALIVRAGIATVEAKEAAWEELFVKRSVPAGQMVAMVATAFWRTQQADLLRPWCDAYLDQMAGLGGGGMLSVLSLINAAFPKIGDQAFLDRVASLAADPATNPTVRSGLLTGADSLGRMLKARLR